MYYLKMFVFSLFFTEVVELFLSLLFGFRHKEQFVLLLLVNLLTNPLAVWLHAFCAVPQILIEFAVILAEFYVYSRFQIQAKLPNSLALSLVLNLTSWGIGLLFQQL